MLFLLGFTVAKDLQVDRRDNNNITQHFGGSLRGDEEMQVTMTFELIIQKM